MSGRLVIVRARYRTRGLLRRVLGVPSASNPLAVAEGPEVAIPEAGKTTLDNLPVITLTEDGVDWKPGLDLPK